MSEWTTTGHDGAYLAGADDLPQRGEDEAVLLEHVPGTARRVLDLGTGDGPLLAPLGAGRPESRRVGLDVSVPMLDAARKRLARDRGVDLIDHDLAEALRGVGFDDVDRAWKWRELALLVGVKRATSGAKD